MNESLFLYILSSDADSRTLATKGKMTGYGTKTKYGKKSQFGSCTASTPTEKSYKRALESFISLGLDKADLHDEDIAIELYDFICNGLIEIFDLESTSCNIFLTPSGTDVEMLSSSILHNAHHSPSTNFILAPSEIGSGSVYAADGRRFSSIAPDGSLGEVGIVEFPDLQSQDVILVEYRDSEGNPEKYDEWEKKLINQLDSISGKKIIHYVKCTKTGIEVPKKSTIREIKNRYGDDIDIIVDAAQGRMDRQEIKKWIEQGSLVFVTGSKFFSGPPFCSALFVPKKFDVSETWSNDFHTYFDPSSFPKVCRKKKSNNFSTKPRIGHLVRWIFGIENMKSLYSIPKKIRDEFTVHFHEKSIDSINNLPNLSNLLDSETDHFPHEKSIVSFFIKKQNSSSFEDLKELRSIYYNFQNNNEKFHIPQPTKLLDFDDEKAVFRLAIGSDKIEELWDMTQNSSKTEALEHLSQEITQCLGAISLFINEYWNRQTE